MCGFIAAFTVTPLASESARQALDRLARRGPDGEGEWRNGGVYLGHRRLAILDLDPRAVQPMESGCARYVIVFNGEIYNYLSLRGELEAEGVRFRTTSDTEVILALYATWGEAMLPRLHGMFAFVIWDRVGRQAFAARDPYGIKPLYIAKTGDGILLCSQVKALLATGLISREPDANGQAGFWMLGSVPEPHTWYRDIQAVPAGHSLRIRDKRVISSRCWHDIGRAWRNAPARPDLPRDEVTKRVRAALRESVARHLVADVPVGVFLSGGIDSGALAGLMAETGVRSLQGVTIAFDEFTGRQEDEAPVAAALARHYDIEHHVRRVTREEFVADLPRILDAMDQPSIDGVNTWYATKAVAELGLKVVVSGVGGDELFLGYEGFRQLPRLVGLWSRWSKVPGAMPVARLAGRLQARRTGNGRWCHAPEWARTIGGAWWLRRSTCGPEELRTLMGEDLAEEALDGFVVEARLAAMTGPLPQETTLALAQIESMTYLRNQLLRDSDWASMDHSVELRTPLVDAHLLEQVQPLLGKFDDFPNKTLLAQAPVKALSREIVERRKTGFGIPVQRWLEEDNGRNDVVPRMNWQREIGRVFG
ncbi:MAG: asparagine synthase (glutamine-hydrolyzing) [Candidatus Thiosymbion ectosymbiont of Robbea hypermnestra]|nr:asparagine synthase (glutamine-hydrolyzing) [Candidatus Thiosymbion ectosymbiont of Robbea hypermnestra]